MAEAVINRRSLIIAAAVGVITGGIGHWRRRDDYEWNGTALGADARIFLPGTAAIAAERVVNDCRSEIERLEQIFSLYRVGSEIVRLNNDGFLREATPELRAVIAMARRVHVLTGGLFDPTVQPVWQAYANWHALHGEAPLPDQVRKDAVARMGLSRLVSAGRSVRLPEGGAITLNGIAQGFITDRIAALLQRHGFDSVLVDIGEVRALGMRDGSHPFQVAIKESGQTLDLAEASLATSSASSLTFSNAQGLGHILHPATAATPGYWRSATVRHASAAIADGLSTALAIATPDQARHIVSATGGCAAWMQDRGRITSRLSA